MTIFPPHGPIHEQTEFWYDPNERALLFEVNIRPKIGDAIAAHDIRNEIWHSSSFRRDPFHSHDQPHGICFKDAYHRGANAEANVANTELVVRLWHQVEENEQPIRTRFREPLIPVPKALALFLDGEANGHASRSFPYASDYAPAKLHRL